MVKNLSILGSTHGTDLSAIVESINNGELKGLARIAIVISDKKNSGILEKARNYNLNWLALEPQKSKKEEYDRILSETIKSYNVDLIVEIGYMRLHNSEFVREFKNKIMNVHPSLLPSFPGIDRAVHEEVLNYGCKISGCTIHFIDEGKDTGPIIMQGAVPVFENDNIDNLKVRVQEKEQELYPKVIKLFCEGKLKVEGRRVYILK